MEKKSTNTLLEYKSNFLKNVIFRLDFNNIQVLETNAEPTFSTAISNKYNSSNQKIIKELKFSIAPDGTKTHEEKSWVLWEYSQKNCPNKIVSLVKNALIFECRNSEYKNFISFKEDVEFIFSKFLENYNLNQFNRMGLRYINEIVIPENNPLKWEGFINPDLCTTITAGINTNFLAVRSMHQLQTKKDDINVLFNYGVFNRDYPNPIAKPELILDYDYYMSGLLDKNEILDKLTDLNSLSKQTFEDSIGDKLREKMGVINNEN